MPQVDSSRVSVDEFEEIDASRPTQTDFDRIVERVMTRRSVLAGGVALGASAFVLATAGLAPRTARAAGEMGFTPIAANTMDTVTVPEGHSWHIVSMWARPLVVERRRFRRGDRRHRRKPGTGLRRQQ